jgi:hypothetical protein
MFQMMDLFFTDMYLRPDGITLGLVPSRLVAREYCEYTLSMSCSTRAVDITYLLTVTTPTGLMSVSSPSLPNFPSPLRYTSTDHPSPTSHPSRCWLLLRLPTTLFPRSPTMSLICSTPFDRNHIQGMLGRWSQRPTDRKEPRHSLVAPDCQY